MCATLISQGPNTLETFIVEQTAPDGFTPKGRFIGGDGYFRLDTAGGGFTLEGSARFKPGPRTSAAADRCILLGDNEPGATVHFHAHYLPWQNELLPNTNRALPPGFHGTIS
jgi:hypothetical protein